MDSRDLIEQRDELKESVHASFVEQFPHYEEMTPDFDSILFEEEEIESWKEDWQDELDSIKEIDDLENEVSSSEWSHGISFVHEDEFEDYCEDMVIDCGYLPKDLPWWIKNHIDWSGVADEMRADYKEVKFERQTFYYRG